MKQLIPKEGTYESLSGKKLIYCGRSEDLNKTHPDVKFRTLHSGKGNYAEPNAWNGATYLYLPKKEWKRLNKEFKEAQEAPQRDLSLVMHALDSLVPEVREQIINLANDQKISSFYSSKPTSFRQLFAWAEAPSPVCGGRWIDISKALCTPSLRKGHPAFIQPFEWVKDRPPTREDADKNGYVSCYEKSYKSKVTFRLFSNSLFEAGLPWAKMIDTYQFTDKNPAPSPFDQ